MYVRRMMNTMIVDPNDNNHVQKKLHLWESDFDSILVNDQYVCIKMNCLHNDWLYNRSPMLFRRSMLTKK